MQNALTQKIIALGDIYHLPANWLTQRPHLFSEIMVNLSFQEAKIIRNTIRNIETIAALPAFQTQVLDIVQKKPKNPGVLFGYDFHLTPEGPKLIEINTNAGGAFFIALLEEAHGKADALKGWQAHFMAMFLAEWQSINPTQLLKTIAIVDNDPLNQYFYPEFLLFQALFQAHHIRSMLVDPSALSLKADKLWANDMPIDLIYNRLTDFDFSQTMHRVLKDAPNQTVITPHPYAHALYAHKRNLTRLSDKKLLMDCGADEKTVQQLQTVMPPAHMVDSQQADNLWATRKAYFFKPVSSYGGKGVYRGHNITRGVFSEILAGNYIAQTLVPPSEMQADGQRYKIDLRAYAYKGEVLGFAARLYLGQTTNMRTPGGGFAAVNLVP